MSAGQKNNKPTIPIENIKQMELLHQIFLSIYSAYSEDDFFSILKNELPGLCDMDFIEWSFDRKTSHKNTSYTHKCKNTHIPCYIVFHKQKGFDIEQKKQLKKISQILEKAFIRIQRCKQLKASKDQWELAFDTIATPLCLISPDGKILRTNKTFRQKTKMTKKELFQKDYFQIFFGHCKKTSSRQHQKVREKRRGLNGEIEFFEIFIQEIAQTTKHRIKLVILKDITQQIQIEKKLARSAQSSELQIISRSIAHELNNPIGGISMLLQVLQLKNKEKIFSKDLDEMFFATQRCLQIINRLLNIPSETCLKS